MVSVLPIYKMALDISINMTEASTITQKIFYLSE